MPRNYKTNPHTARWLMTFHRGAGLNYSPQASADAEERSAMNFLTGNATPHPDGELIRVSDWLVKIGPGLATEKQAKYMISIAHRPSVTHEMRASLQIRLEQGFARSAASAFITKYKDIPIAAEDAVGPTASSAEEVRSTAKISDGRYAVEEDGVLKFFKVKNGRKAGYVFLDIQASDDWHAVRNVTRIRSILATIAEVGEHAAMVRYGHELGVCGRCGRTLTDEASRAAGIGPVCASKD
jgi:hypothetical protein